MIIFILSLMKQLPFLILLLLQTRRYPETAKRNKQKKEVLFLSEEGPVCIRPALSSGYATAVPLSARR
jgi:hypothetical protein